MPTSPAAVLTSLNVAPDWKAVGSSRRSSSNPRSPEPQQFYLQNQNSLSRTPNSSQTDPPAILYRKPSVLGVDLLNPDTPENFIDLKTLASANSQWGQQSGWNGNGEIQENSQPKTMSNGQRQYRNSNPYSLQGIGNSYTPQKKDFAGEPIIHEPLRGSDDEESDDYTQFSLSKMRSRSKSSSAIFGIDGDVHQPEPNRRASHTAGQKDYQNYPDLNSIWAMSKNMPSAAAPINEQAGLRSGHEPALLHRRASTQPSYAPVWENMRGPLNVGDQSRNSSPDRYRPIRRFSHAPAAYAEYSHPTQPHVSRAIAIEDPNRRRHSLAGPPFNSSTQYITEGLETLDLNESENVNDGNLDGLNAINTSAQDPAIFHDIDDYFENTDHRTRAWVEAGKNLQAQHDLMQQQYPQSPTNLPQSLPVPTQQYQQQQYNANAPQWPLYVVEFKAGRTDFFFIDERASSAGTLPPKLSKGELVIVEGDRGIDLGKVIFDNIQNQQQLALYQSTNKFTQYAQQQGDDPSAPVTIHAKRVIRLAHSNDVAMLVAKSQDEAKAMGVCQSKIRQRRLPMEVVDAEYQWDRKKLTFYFVADRRIDFRELVRELFKLYKTRIW
ncbi:hypothetical protein HK096_007266, partial [Nowakowskiella sp. JEL0078]